MIHLYVSTITVQTKRYRPTLTSMKVPECMAVLMTRIVFQVKITINTQMAKETEEFEAGEAGK
jgi:hypothetical protein